jgi:hypothetical protein
VLQVVAIKRPQSQGLSHLDSPPACRQLAPQLLGRLRDAVTVGTTELVFRLTRH